MSVSQSFTPLAPEEPVAVFTKGEADPEGYDLRLGKDGRYGVHHLELVDPLPGKAEVDIQDKD